MNVIILNVVAPLGINDEKKFLQHAFMLSIFLTLLVIMASALVMRDYKRMSLA
jgi:hypothetical protein